MASIHRINGCNSFHFYIKPQQCIGHCGSELGCNSFHFYIKPQLLNRNSANAPGCNSFHFYIKPQQEGDGGYGVEVVIHSISTSNHNSTREERSLLTVVIHSISTSNHNV